MSPGVIIGIIIAAVAIIAIALVIVMTKLGKQDDRKADSQRGVFLDTESSGQANVPLEPDSDVSISFAGGSDSYNEEYTEIIAEQEDAERFQQALEEAAREDTDDGDADPPAEVTTRVSGAQARGDEIDQIRVFFSGVYYVKGTLFGDDGNTPFELAVSGQDLETVADFDGNKLSFVRQNGKMYVKNPDSKTYAVLNSTLMSMMGMSDGDFKFSLGNMPYDADEPDEVAETEYEGAPAREYIYKNSESTAVVTVVNGKVRLIATGSSADSAVPKLLVDELSGSIPDDMLTLNGYKKQNVLIFFGNLAS